MLDLKYIEMETAPNPTATVIWLHGLGANGHDFEPIVPELKLPSELAVRFIFPHAPAIPVTINGGFVMPAWYDILEMDVERKVDDKQLRASAQAVTALVEQELSRGIASDRIVLAGFSQGGAVAYEAALSFDKPLAGLLALSTYFATSSSIEVTDANRNLPIEIMHGDHDQVVPVSLGLKAQAELERLGFVGNVRRYPVDHSVCLEEIRDISAWLQSVLSE